jgi:ribosomal protein S27AE
VNKLRFRFVPRFFFSSRYRKELCRAIYYEARNEGKIKIRPCEACGAKFAYAHHEDYTKPLRVRWLCPKHHAERHKTLRKIHGVKIIGIVAAKLGKLNDESTCTLSDPCWRRPVCESIQRTAVQTLGSDRQLYRTLVVRLGGAAR